MVTLDPLDLDLVIVFASVVVTAFIARWTHLPITALEIIAGIALVTALRFDLPTGTESIIILGSLFIVFLAGFETGFDFLRSNIRKALMVGVPGFLGPFFGLFAILYYLVHAPLFISLVGATVLADTSISITYTTLQQYELADLPFGRLVLASTLCINLAEDFTITSATVLSTPGFLFTIAILSALAVAALALPRLSKAIEGNGEKPFTNIGARSLLLSLAVFALLSALVGVPGILFIFLSGLIFSRLLPPSAWKGYLANVRPIAFALFIPLYFVAVGLKVDFAFVVSHWPLLVGLLGVGSVLKMAALFPVVRRAFGKERAAPVTVLMNTRLTSATVILTLVLGLGLISTGWYSVYITVVVVLALVSSAAVRAFPGFKNVASARALFGASSPAVSEPSNRPAPVPGSLDT